MKKVRQFCELSKKELFKLRKRILKRSYRNGTWLLNDVRCVRPSSVSENEMLVKFSDLSDEEKGRLEKQRRVKMKRDGRDLLDDVDCFLLDNKGSD